MPYNNRKMLSVLLISILAFGAGWFAATHSTELHGAEHTESGKNNPAKPHVKAPSMIEAGRYLVIVGGCNDCHTPGYRKKGGNVPESRWLTGIPIGWRGPWGTTYAPNLRLYVQDMSEEEWLEKMRTLESRPTMPWFNIRKMSDRDLRAVYRYIEHLGPRGKRMPNYVPPGKQPGTPFIYEVPQKPN